MTKIQNTFLSAIVQNDLDERLTDGALIGQPKNISVFTNDQEHDSGVLKNVAGNVKQTDYGYLGGETIGTGKNENQSKIYDFIKGTDYDYVIEYNALTGTSTRVLQYSTGGVLNFISGERITQFDYFVDAETGFILIAWSGDSNPPRIVNVETAKAWAVNDFTNDEISLMKPSPIFAPAITLTTSIEGVENNFIEDKFLCFGTRYKYSDGYFSAPSSWTKPAFNPKEFDLDYQTFENLGMLNLSNAVDIDFNTGARDVVQIDLLFRESNTTSIYVIEQFVKAEEGWGDNTVQSFQFSKAKIYTVLPEDQFFRNFDNVPLSARVQTAIGNRIAYANFIEGRNITENIDFDVTLVTENPFQSEINGAIEQFVGDDYPNVVDYSRGQSISGADIDQMDYATNTVEMVLADIPTADRATFIIEVTPKDSDLTKDYTITVKDGATVLQQWTGLSGVQTESYTSATGVDENVTIYVTSDEGLLYSCKLRYIPKFTVVPVLEYDYFCDFQLCLPKSGGYGATLVGDTIVDTVADFDMTGYVFKNGTQIRINLTLQSSLVETWKPIMTFFYNLTSDYTDLTDFLANSSFVYQLQTVFTQTFKNNYQSGVGTFVSIADFVVSQSGNNLLVQMPILVYDVDEPNSTVVAKTEFYLITETTLQTVNANAFTSLHSNRDYEVGLIYMDEQGRKTTILNAQNNTIHIPALNSVLSNKLSVHINNNPPSWAKYYKFTIKQVKRDYEVVYGNVVYADGVYRWLQLDGESRNKVNAGDLLTVKSDYSGALTEVRKVKVLEVGFQNANFITGNLKVNGDEIIENAGFYMKIKQGDFDLAVTQDAYQTYQGTKNGAGGATTTPLFGFYDDTPTFVPTPVNAGSLITFSIEIKTLTVDTVTLNLTKTVQDDYATFKDWFTAEVENDSQFIAFVNSYVDSWEFNATDDKDFTLVPKPSLGSFFTKVTFDANFSGGTLIFETEPIEQLNSSFFETPETYTIVGGHHEFTDHLLSDAYNCFCFGNGAESYKVRDALSGKSFSIDSNPSAVNKEGYRQLNRFADITYSEIYNSNTNVNRLNEFNLSLANYKDDIQKVWGAITVMKGFETDLYLIQEDKHSVVYYGKDLLFNADGSTNLTGIPQVLGQQNSYDGEFGCQNTESFDFYGFNRYSVDVKRGSVIKKSNNGLFEISGQGMRSYFKTLFRDNNIDSIIGQYDQFYDVFMLNIKYNGDQYVTWIYSDSNNGWLGTQTFNPEDMIRLKGDFYTFKNGEVYLHNQEFNNGIPNYNIFYGESFESEASFNFSQDPSQNKIYQALEIEGSTAVQIALETNLDLGYVNQSDFEKKEGFYYAYIRGSNAVLDTSLLTSQGIGNATIVGLNLVFNFPIDPIISVGDVIMNLSEQVVGTILSKTDNTLTLNTVNNLADGDFVFSLKPNSVNGQGILGYYSKVTMTFSSAVRQEIFSVGCEIAISYPT